MKPTDLARAPSRCGSEAMKGWVSGRVARLSDTNVVYHEIAEADRAFYSARTIDVEYRYPFGLKELYGLANHCRLRPHLPRQGDGRRPALARSRDQREGPAARHRPFDRTVSCCFASI